MKSRDLIESSRVDETTPPGVTQGGGAPDPEKFDAAGEGRPQPRGPRRRPGEGSAHGSEVGLLRDALLMTLASRSQLDKGIAEKLLAGQLPDPGEIQHILDEAGPIASTLPEPMQKGLGAIFRRLRGDAS